MYSPVKTPLGALACRVFQGAYTEQAKDKILMITFPLDLIPFSKKGSFLIITARNSSGSPRLLYKTCSGRIQNLQYIPFPADEFFEISLVKNGHQVPYTWDAYPHRLDLHGDNGEEVILTYADAETLIFRAKNTEVRLMPSKVFPAQYSPIPEDIYLIDWFARGIHMFRADKNSTVRAMVTPIVTGVEKHWGEFPCTIIYSPTDNASQFIGAFHFARYETFWNEPLPDFDQLLVDNEKEYASWAEKMPAVPEKYQLTAETAWFILWDCQVPKGDALTRPAIYMSKFWMNGIWAWDNLFNALAVAEADPQLAWDQLMLFFDYQEPNGMIPDMLSDLEPIYGFTKPPLHGWAILKLVQMLGRDESLPYLEEIYKPLSHLTTWWYTYRDFDKDGMPQYFHGNDSGWDNATIFDQGISIEAADLAAYLVLQCECLSFIANALGHKKAAQRWKSKAEKQLTDLLKHSVKDNHFYSPVSGTAEAEKSLSLINYIPILLGNRLPKQIHGALVYDLRPGGLYFTQFGLASEPPTSYKYMPDGYWRGPIWAASTYLIFDGLLQSGEYELAHLIAERFCDLCLEVPGFWENYDALTGKGLRCPGYSWTASVFLLLAEWLESDRQAH
jgi:putative isomerase